jgi:transcriptional regulator GlxA family with amidase domain
MMTGYSTEDLAIKACGKGVAYYMKKPDSLGCLSRKLSEILEGKKKEDYPDSVGSHESFIMEYIARLIEANYMEDLTRDELAKKAHMSLREFSRAFNERFGMGVKSYINNVRVRKAIALINKNHDVSITNIAISVGYGNLTHFERVFRKICGVSPGDYKRKRSGRLV